VSLRRCACDLAVIASGFWTPRRLINNCFWQMLLGFGASLAWPPPPPGSLGGLTLWTQGATFKQGSGAYSDIVGSSLSPKTLGAYTIGSRASRATTGDDPRLTQPLMAPVPVQ
jgi:hypothetical protein